MTCNVFGGTLNLASTELIVQQFFLHCGNRELRAFCSCDLDLDPMTFIYENDPYPLKIYPRTKNELCASRLSKVIALHTTRCHLKPPGRLAPRMTMIGTIYALLSCYKPCERRQ